MAKAVERNIAPAALACTVFVAAMSLGALMWPLWSKWNDRALAIATNDTIKAIYYFICFTIAIYASISIYYHIVLPSKRRFVINLSMIMLSLGATLAIACVGPFQLERLETGAKFAAGKDTVLGTPHPNGDFHFTVATNNSALYACIIYVIMLFACVFFSLLYLAICLWNEGYNPLTLAPRSDPGFAG